MNFFLQYSQSSYTMKWQRQHFNVHIYILTVDYVVIWIKFKRLLWINYFEAPNTCRRAIEEPKEMMTLIFVRYWFFTIECTKIDIIVVSIPWNSCDLIFSSKKISIYMYIWFIFAIVSPWKMVWIFIWTNLHSFYKCRWFV